MRKLTNLVIGAAIGAVVGMAVHYLLGPGDRPQGEAMVKDEVPYRSRLETAIDAGRQAAEEREAELLASFEQSKRT